MRSALDGDDTAHLLKIHCPTTCGYDGTDISDGCGGTIACDATPACEDDDECVPTYTQDDCPDACGLDASVIDDDCGNDPVRSDR